jgi:hypothetical protein
MKLQQFMKPYELRTPTGTFDVTPIAQDRAPAELGDLSRNSFAYLGQWQHERYQDGTGWAFRLGIKKGVIDSEGDPATLMVLFPVGLVPKGYTPRESLEAKLKAASRAVVERLTIAAAQTYDNVMTVVQNPSEEMLRELEEALR